MVRKKIEPASKELEYGDKAEADKDSEEKMRLVYTAEEILDEVDELPDSHMTRTETRMRRTMYKDAKEKVHAMERNNYSKLIVLRDYRMPWFKSGGNSALIYAFELAGKMGKSNISINVDKDGYSTFNDGVVSYNGTKNLIQNMRKLGYGDPKVIANGWILIFNLGKEYEKSELKAMKKAKRTRELKINSLVTTSTLYSNVYHNILTTCKRFPPNLFKLNPNQRQAFVPPATEELIKLHSLYLDLTNGRTTPLKGGEAMVASVTKLQSIMKIIAENGFWEMGVCAAVGQALTDLSSSISSEILAPEKEHLKKLRLKRESQNIRQEDAKI